MPPFECKQKPVDIPGLAGTSSGCTVSVVGKNVHIDVWNAGQEEPLILDEEGCRKLAAYIVARVPHRQMTGSLCSQILGFHPDKPDYLEKTCGMETGILTRAPQEE